MKFQDIGPRAISIKSELEGLLAEVCHCCNQRVLILQFAPIRIMTGRLELSSGTHC